MSLPSIKVYLESEHTHNDSAPLFVHFHLELGDLQRMVQVEQLLAREDLSEVVYRAGAISASAQDEPCQVSSCHITAEGLSLAILEGCSSATFTTKPVPVEVLRSAFDHSVTAFLGFDPSSDVISEAIAHFEDAIGFDRDEFHDFAVSHGYGEPTEEGYRWAAAHYEVDKDYASIASDVVAHGYTVGGDDFSPTP